ncbi:TonB-dependent receptor plug domain-containing protein [Pedobacter sp. HDW13]|uniref:TonB-dependent receptor n=1 Tax=unclassified Pedobacter TaxID=2628915 RepID=UPI000F59E4FB|nr:MULTISPECIES: TonB-dependent receptor [unclassified Pedobacter]QIL42008.1 TonB-dependent receptor plug domain-containing protein [Pedobacter sp. HDW13]RQO64638.1 TonB-dependent receptor [Pedobacter sp. KBW01]
MLKLRLLFLLLIAGCGLAVAQPLVRVSGIVQNEEKLPLAQVTVIVLGQAQSTVTDEFGVYTIYSKSKSFSIKYSLLGYQPQTIKFNERSGARILQKVNLIANINELEQVNITNKQNQLSNATTINVTDIGAMPLVSGNFETMLKTLPGVSTNNELSAQYSVRGGNFDENLIYINDVEINRPVLIRNGQQEGLSFINSDLVSKAKFSAGGFEAKYGDKLSSILDIRYDKPDSNQTILSTSLLNTSLSTKQVFKHSFLLAGLRYKNNTSVLIKQDEKGSYSPNYADAQVLYQYDFSPKFNISFLSNFNIGQFKLVPTNRETQFGTLSTTLKLNVDYTGQEIDDYQTFGSAVTAAYSPRPNLVVKFINSYFNTIERERFDINGSYVFAEVDNNFSGENFGPVSKNKGIGSYYNYGRNSLNTQVFASEIKVDQNFNSHVFSWGFKFDQSTYNDKLNEYNYTDSAGFILPNNGKNVVMQNVINVKNNLDIKNYSAYIQDSYSLSSSAELQLGARATYGSLSKQLLISPRMLIAYRPNSNNKILRFTAGVYKQPPSYRTIRNFSGVLNVDQKAQSSYNTSLGYEYAFDAFGTRLKFTSEAYFKYSDRLIPYKIDNLRIKYLANEISKGYAYGADFSIGGEFVKDLVSYFRMSVMHANEDIIGDSYVQNGTTIYPGYLKRPTDQRLNFSIFFQDRLLNSPTYKVHLNALYGSRLPIGPTQTPRYLDQFFVPSYKRVDIGFSKDFLDDTALHKPKFLDRNFSSVILFFEVFNLLNIDNTVSYLWLKDVDNVQYAIPNYLTGRQFNLKLIVKLKNN